MKLAKKIFKIVLIIVMIVCLASCAKSCWEYTTYKSVTEFKLDEISDGIYGCYNTVTSSIPAENYEMIVLCIDGQIYTMKGNVNIRYTESTPKLIFTNVNVVNGDTMDVYVPYNSIEFRPNLTQG